MTPADYLDASKLALGITSDNGLATLWKIHRQRISSYRTGKEWPDNYAVMQFAIALQLDPARVLADLEGQREKDAQKRQFWLSFLQRASMGAVLISTLALNYSAISGNAFAAHLTAWHDSTVRIIRGYVNQWLSQCEKRLQQIMEPCDYGTTLCPLRPAVKT